MDKRALIYVMEYTKTDPGKKMEAAMTAVVFLGRGGRCEIQN
jgi:hypothetical protein